MRIESSVIGMESARRYQSSRTQSTRFVLKDYSDERAESNMYMSEESIGTGDAEEELKNQTEKTTDSAVTDWEERIGTLKRNNICIRESADSTVAQFRYYTTRYIFMLLFGDEAKKFFDDEPVIKGTDVQQIQQPATLELTPMKQVSFTSESYYEETENVLFKSKGKVTTADGREITFNVDVGMSRSFQEYYKEEYDIAAFQRVCDPLVINLGNNVAELSDQKFFFDIDADGEIDEIAELAEGSGYLALDKNNDGKINDGSELFGPQSGDGFADLSEYDEDGNGWIDENDSVWNKLKIWCRNENGEDELYTLAEKGVGALCLQKAATDFSLKDTENNDKGYIRSTGIFLYENGNVGTMQHLDLVQ